MSKKVIHTSKYRQTSKKHEKVLKSRFSPQQPDKTKGLKFILVIISVAAVLILGICIMYSVSTLLNVLPKNQTEASSDVSQASVISEQELNTKLLTLVNRNNSLPEDYPLELTSYDNIIMDKSIVESLKQMISDAQKAGIELNVYAGYISFDEQNKLHNTEVERLLALDGYTPAKAEDEAAQTVPSGGYAEEQTGLSLRFAEKNDKSFSSSQAYVWLDRNSFKYGFILRYPKNKSDETEHEGDSSLFRYVGKDYAVKIRTLDMCLEEYVTYLNRR